MTEQSGDVTILLRALRRGERDLEPRLLEAIYGELKRLARAYLRRERPDHSMHATDLVHEAYLRLAGDTAEWQDRAHFFGVAAQAMRRILVDHARAHRAQKRGGGGEPLPLDEALSLSTTETDHLVELDEALDRLMAIDARQGRIVELRFFAGMSVDETAEVLGCGARTVNREWRVAQAWLRREMSADLRP